MSLSNYALYTDGACSGNPGPGGWAVLALAQDDQDEPSLPRIRGELAGGDPATTNNRMELTAVIQALRHEPEEYSRLPLTLHSDSEYVLKAFNEGWLDAWQRKGWRTAKGKEVANRDLWQSLLALVSNRPGSIQWNWVKGHNGDALNEMADRKAVLYSQQARREKEPFQEGTLIFQRPATPVPAEINPYSVVEGSCRELPEETALPVLPERPQLPPAAPRPQTHAELRHHLLNSILENGLSEETREKMTMLSVNGATKVDLTALPSDQLTLTLRYPDGSGMLLRLQCVAAELLPSSP